MTSGTNVISQFGYGYDSAGDIASWSQQAGAGAPVNYAYGYDGADQLLQATASVSGSQSPIDAYAYLYDAAGNRTTEQINASVTTSAYNALNQMTSRSGGGLLTISGSVSQPSVMTIGGGSPFVTGSTSTSTSFSAQVAVVTGSNNIQISATNVNGYGTTQTLGVNVTSGTPIPSLTYDLDGNLTNDGTQVYKYDVANRLIEVDEASGNISRFAYDGLGHRALITETATNGSVTTKNLVWDGRTICEEKNASDAVTKAYFDQGVQLAGSNYYYTRDHLGSIRELTDSNANVQAEYSYDPYGRQTQTSGTMTADFGYTGLYYHQPSGLVLAEYRGYMPPLGRWISRDPIAEEGGINLYGYTDNDPLNYSDPSGKCPWCIAAAVGAVLGAGVNAYDNYHAFHCGNLSGADYAKSILFGAGTGALAGLAPGIVGGMITGAVMGGLNQATNSALVDGNFNWGQAGEAAAIGAGGGLLGGLGGTMGDMVIDPESIGTVAGSDVPSLKDTGAAIGSAVGAFGGDYLQNNLDKKGKCK